MRTVHVLVSGRVQGVCFRECTRLEGERLDINGWVKNLSDGSVEAIVQGDDDGAVEKMLDWMRHGPQFARVDSFHAEDVNIKERFTHFTVSYD
jgi:acylphosphatase